MPEPDTTHQEAVAAFRLSVVGDLLIRDLERPARRSGRA